MLGKVSFSSTNGSHALSICHEAHHLKWLQGLEQPGRTLHSRLLERGPVHCCCCCWAGCSVGHAATPLWWINHHAQSLSCMVSMVTSYRPKELRGQKLGSGVIIFSKSEKSGEDARIFQIAWACQESRKDDGQRKRARKQPAEASHRGWLLATSTFKRLLPSQTGTQRQGETFC